MTRRLLLARPGSNVVVPDPDPDPDPNPGGGVEYNYPEFPNYSIPAAAPYNVATPCVTPTDDGTGHVVHPDGIAFAEPWNGHCFWHAATAYFNADDWRENPHVYYSDDGWNWHWPPGVTNPIDPWPGAPDNVGNYNSDTDITFDPDTNELIVTWREVIGSNQRIWGSKSSDGSTWSAPIEIYDASFSETGGGAFSTSQSLVRVGPGEWRLYFAVGSGSATYARFLTSDSPLGPFGNSTTITYTGAATTPYHGDVTYDPTTGLYYSLFIQGISEYPGVSEDGINFAVRPAILGAIGTGTPGEQNMYRSGIQPHHNGTHMHVWYTSHSNVSGRHPHYTVIPLTRWTGA